MIHSPSSSFITFSEVWLTSLIALSMVWFWLGNPYMESGTIPSASTWRRSSSERLDNTGGSKCMRWWIQNNPIHLHWYSLFTKKLYHHNTVHWRILYTVVYFWPLVALFRHFIIRKKPFSGYYRHDQQSLWVVSIQIGQSSHCTGWKDRQSSCFLRQDIGLFSRSPTLKDFCFWTQ